MNENTSTAWDEAKLNELIRDGIEEGYSLEYKGAGALSRDEKPKTEITKDVSAMANSAGGVLIYGLAEFNDKPREHLPERIDPVSRKDFSREWLENIIFQIRPRISGLKIHSVQLSSDSDHVAYIVEIPEGSTAHQARDCIYYRRFNFQAVPMPDNEVRGVMNRQQFPTLSVSATLAFYGEGGALHFEIQNTGDVLARYFALVIHTPVRWKKGKFIFDDKPTVVELEDGQSYRSKFSNALGAPLFPKSSVYNNFKFTFASFPEPKATISNIRYRVYADAMPFIEGTFDPELIAKHA